MLSQPRPRPPPLLRAIRVVPEDGPARLTGLWHNRWGHGWEESPWSHSASALRPPGPESTGPFLAPGQTQRRGKTVRATWPAHWLTPLSTSPPSRHPRLLALDLPLGSPRSWSVFPTKHACGPHFLLAGEAGPVGWPWRGGQGHDGSILRVLLEKAKVFCIHLDSSKPLSKARVGGSSLGPHPSPPAWSSQQGSEEGDSHRVRAQQSGS